MKIRTGFVSNSSSSSFVIALNKKPNDIEATKKLLFGTSSDNDSSVEYCDYNLSRDRVAEIFYNDIIKSEKVTLKNITEAFIGRYYYCSDGFYETDGSLHTGFMYSGKYFGTSKELLKKIKDTRIEEKNHREKYCKEIFEVLNKYFKVKRVEYASYASKDTKTGKPNTIKQIKEYEDYSKKRSVFEKTNKEYLAVRDRHNKETVKMWDLRRKLEYELATLDAKKFMEDNKGKFITVLSYSNNDGEEGCVMEHSGVLENLNCIRISNH